MNAWSHIKRAAIILNRSLAPILRALGVNTKRLYELAYWHRIKLQKGTLRNAHYEAIYTDLFELDSAFYAHKTILDIGCGPRGSLEWANEAVLRIGLDPLAVDYSGLGIGVHQMNYINAPAERMPFADQSFDVVMSLNSLDHVDNLDHVVCEVIRVVKPGGLFLLIVEVHSEPTVAEPIIISWKLAEKFQPHLNVIDERHFEINPERRGAVAGVRSAIPFNHSDLTERSGVLFAKMMKVA